MYAAVSGTDRSGCCACRPKAFLILREKDLAEADYGMLAVQVLDICYHYEVPCLLHTYVEVARQLNHPYIHLPLHVLAQYAGKLKDFKQVGCSVHSVDEACLAVSYGATYLQRGIFMQPPVNRMYRQEG